MFFDLRGAARHAAIKTGQDEKKAKTAALTFLCM